MAGRAQPAALVDLLRAALSRINQSQEQLLISVLPWTAAYALEQIQLACMEDKTGLRRAAV
jgi:hypothetical protein